MAAIFDFQQEQFLLFFDLQVSRIGPIKFQVSWQVDLGDEAQNKFSRWRTWRPFWNSNQTDFNPYPAEPGHTLLLQIV